MLSESMLSESITSFPRLATARRRPITARLIENKTAAAEGACSSSSRWLADARHMRDGDFGTTAAETTNS